MKELSTKRETYPQVGFTPRLLAHTETDDGPATVSSLNAREGTAIISLVQNNRIIAQIRSQQHTLSLATVDRPGPKLTFA